MASPLRYLPTILSSLFRLASYIFLRVIPTTLAKPVLPSLYVLHILTSWFLSPPSSETSGVYKYSEKTKSYTKDSNGSDPLRTLVFSLPSTSRRLRFTNIFINTVLIFAAADFALSPFVDTATDLVFTRVGAVYPDSIKIVARYPLLNSTESTLRVVFREWNNHAIDQGQPWKNGPLMNFTEERDWVDTVKLDGLWPNSSYEYALATIDRTSVAFPMTPVKFRTFPDPRLPTGNHFRFVVSSCVTHNHPYAGPFHRRTIRGFDLLADYLFPHTSATSVENSGEIDVSGAQSPAEGTSDETKPPPINVIEIETQRASVPPAEFLLFLGDFIYADVPLYIGDDKEAYRRLYRRNYQSNSFRKIYERLPIFHAYDDHEFINNFGANGNDSTPPYPNASDAFKIYNSDANYDPPTPGQHYYDFQYGDSAFFVMDTRRHRSNGTADTLPTMLGDIQVKALLEWLSRVNGTSTFKFVATSVPFTSLWGRDAAVDSWAGFTAEKTALLEAFHSVPNVILLSGDRHEFAAIEFNSPGAENIVREFSTSPISMFYIPFFRTLKLQSDATIQRNGTKIQATDNETEIVHSEEIPQEKVFKYLPIGNHKWSAFEIDTRDPERPMLRLEVMIDGKPSYHFGITGKPVKLQSSTALGALVSSGIKDIFDRFGIKPRAWF